MKHPPETVWEAITDPTQLSKWYMTKARIDARVGGSIDYFAGISQFHVTGSILVWDPPRVFEHEWNVEPRPELPSGERSLIRWEIIRDGEDSILKLTHRNLTRRTARGFGPGTHAFLDRLEALLDESPLPDWRKRVEEMRSSYPGWTNPMQ
ncbi:MAG TPA: SRPBCC domain-containing protein [Nitrososphaerales archaeon]|nr:SRPBCC domain-containing protein [Nitrososphaerales archaeon]